MALCPLVKLCAFLSRKLSPTLLTLFIILSAPTPAHSSDEFSSGDKLRTLYSNHFTFTDKGLPQVTIELMGGQKEVRLSAGEGLLALPDGEGGAVVEGNKEWVVRIEKGKPGKVREWTIVARVPAKDALEAEVEVARWKKLGHKSRSFEVGTIFAVAGDVLDTREVLIAIDPMPQGKGAEHARKIGQRYDLKSTVHSELIRRPSGTIVATSGGISLRNPSVLWFKNRNGSGTIAVDNVQVGQGGSQLKTRRVNRRYFGSIYLTVGSDGKLSVVNAVAADSLLSGLVPSEMFPDAPMEALKAQTIAARTELLHKLGLRHFGDPFLLCATQHCQVYSGAGHEHPRTTKAVKSTRGQVLISHKDALVDARYSATCGGHSEHNEVVWGGQANPTLRGSWDGSPMFKGHKGITDANIDSFLRNYKQGYCAHTPYSKGRYRWKVSMTTEQLSRRVNQKYSGVGRILSVNPLKRGISGRISELQLQGSKKSMTIRGELNIRRLLGGLRSSLFRVVPKGPKTQPSSFVFDGAGFGHGVGMCQLGAIGMAQNGHSVAAILRHYYKKSKLHRLY